jgi:uncharacterized protein YdaU (DUF1376 family)
MVAFYKHNISAWRGGTSDLSDRAYRVYHVIVEQIMLHEGPVPYHERSLAGLSNRSTRDFRAAFQELTDAGKLQVVNGKITNNRAEIELDSIRANRENAAKGGRKVGERSVNGPRMVDERCSNGAPIVDDRRELSNEINGDEQATLNKLTSLKEKRREDLSSLRSDNAHEQQAVKPKAAKWLEAFELWYAAYPHKVGRDAAEKAFERVAKSGKVTSAELMAGLDAYKRSKPSDREWCNPATWLNQGRWADQPATSKAEIGVKADAPPDWRSLMSAYCAAGAWQWPKLSPEPGAPGCKIPPEIIAEFAGKLPKSLSGRSAA